MGSEILRRVQETLQKYNACIETADRQLEQPNFLYSTPYNNMVKPHMDVWNEIMIDAIKCPAGLSNPLWALDVPKLRELDFIPSEW